MKATAAEAALVKRILAIIAEEQQNNQSDPVVVSFLERIKNRIKAEALPSKKTD